ncbi:DUF559 domain-containing protein [Moorella naiadis]|uniref:DUF559 domain-containing protein n=1 Tax=Moorella naiadis (nom. illeg.) TaxID=3093670 RepID=UPI003D9CAD1B
MRDLVPSNNASGKVQSEFEREVMRRLVNCGYRVQAQWPVGYYRIDLVVKGKGRRLAIECDGDRYHPLEKLEEDMARQAILERLGWRFVRIRGSHFFRDPDGAMQVVSVKYLVMSWLNGYLVQHPGSGSVWHDGPRRKASLKDGNAGYYITLVAT